MTTTRSADADTQLTLFRLVAQERRARDIGDWATMESLYWPDSWVRVTWFAGTAAEFIAMSKRASHAGRAGGIHVITPAWCEVDGDRALVESQGQILIRPRLDGVECDAVNWCRFFSRAERRDGQWRLLTFDAIYGKDRIDPVLPDADLRIDPGELAAARASYRYFTYLNQRSGHAVPDDLPGDDRPDLVEHFHAEARAWLHEEVRARGRQGAAALT